MAVRVDVAVAVRVDVRVAVRVERRVAVPVRVRVGVAVRVRVRVGVGVAQAPEAQTSLEGQSPSTAHASVALPQCPAPSH